MLSHISYEPNHVVISFFSLFCLLEHFGDLPFGLVNCVWVCVQTHKVFEHKRHFTKAMRTFNGHFFDLLECDKNIKACKWFDTILCQLTFLLLRARTICARACVFGFFCLILFPFWCCCCCCCGDLFFDIRPSRAHTDTLDRRNRLENRSNV